MAGVSVDASSCRCVNAHRLSRPRCGNAKKTSGTSAWLVPPYPSSSRRILADPSDERTSLRFARLNDRGRLVGRNQATGCPPHFPPLFPRFPRPQFPPLFPRSSAGRRASSLERLSTNRPPPPPDRRRTNTCERRRPHNTRPFHRPTGARGLCCAAGITHRRLFGPPPRPIPNLAADANGHRRVVATSGQTAVNTYRIRRDRFAQSDLAMTPHAFVLKLSVGIDCRRQWGRDQ